nr:hypothetical protein BaRGS_009319 [Batillaria attramentaria]
MYVRALALFVYNTQFAEQVRQTGEDPKVNEKETAVPENLLENVRQTRAPSKAQKISRAMQAYMERAQAHDAMMEAQVAEYEIGRRHLANIMGKDPELFDQDDIDKAIEYLLPSGIFEKKARPVLKHPYEIFPKRKAAQFGLDGRPFHSMFYTGKPNFYSLLHEVVWKLESLKREEDKLIRKGTIHEEADKKLSLYGSDWITVQRLKDMMLEPIGDLDHKQFVVLMAHLADHPLSYREEEFIMKHRRKLMVQSFTQDVQRPMVDAEGAEFMTATGKRKSSQAEVTVRMKGSGKFTVNGQDVQYFKNLTHREQVMTPLQFLGRLGEVDVESTVTGGGGSGQSGAIRLALSRALASFVDADTREKMRLGHWSVERRLQTEREEEAWPEESEEEVHM